MTKWYIRNTESSEKHRTPRNMKYDKLVVVKCWSQCITFCQMVFYIISTYYLSSVHTLNLLLRLGVYQFFLLSYQFFLLSSFFFLQLFSNSLLIVPNFAVKNELCNMNIWIIIYLFPALSYYLGNFPFPCFCPHKNARKTKHC